MCVHLCENRTMFTFTGRTESKNKMACALTFVRLALCVIFGLCVRRSAQPEAQGVVPNHRVSQHTRTQRPLLLLLLHAFLFLLFLIPSLLSRLSPLLGRRGGADFGVAVGGHWLPAVGT